MVNSSLAEPLELGETVASREQSDLFGFMQPQKRGRTMGRIYRITTTQDRPWQEVFEDFLSWRTAEGIAPRTLQDYRYHVTRFFDRYPEAWGNYEKLRNRLLLYFGGLTKNSPAYYNLGRQYLGAFFNWCVKQGVLPANPLAGIRKRRDEPKVRNIPEEVLLKLLDLPDKSTFAGFRDYCLLLFTLDTGARPKEALSLRPEDFDLKARQVVIPARHAKTRVSRTLPLSPVTCQAVQRLLAVRPPEWGRAVPVFASADGGTLRELSWNHRLQNYSKKLGVPVNPYSLRHSFAINYLRNGGNPFALQQELGHRDLSMTKRYLALVERDLREAHDIASPVNRLIVKNRRVRKV